MSLRFYNSLTRREEDFVPLNPGKVKMYVCGVTVYDRSHVGHARALVVFDVIYRYLKFRGYEVTFVRNFTDVDDKIIKRANERGIGVDALTEECIEDFHGDMHALRCLPPTQEPRATKHITDMVDLIARLESNGLAYRIEGDVYFAVSRFDDYGKLGHRRLDDMVAGARINVDERKRHPMDFALWKASKPGEPAWDSPWGSGRPGWHVECSAMSTKYLGETFDIHGGGADLIFPHHENEIAQSEGANGKPLAKYWLHNGMVTVEKEKMSKSLGNFLTINAALEKVSTPEVLRQVLLSSHYRMALDFSEKKMSDAERGLERIYETLNRADAQLERSGISANVQESALVKDFCEAMDNDCNTPRALGVIFDGIREMNRLLDSGKMRAVAELLRDIRRVAGVIGLLEDGPRQFLDKKRESGLALGNLTAEVIEELVAERLSARENKNFGRADEIRDQLARENIQLKDGPTGTTWSVK